MKQNTLLALLVIFSGSQHLLGHHQSVCGTGIARLSTAAIIHNLQNANKQQECNQTRENTCLVYNGSINVPAEPDSGRDDISVPI